MQELIERTKFARDTRASKAKENLDLKKRQEQLQLNLGQALEEPPFVGPSKDKKVLYLSKSAVALSSEKMLRK